MSPSEERYRSALEWLATETLPARDGGQSIGSVEDAALFARHVLNGPVPHNECPYDRNDGYGCPACQL